MYLVLSEFGCVHEDNYADTAQVLIQNLSNDLDSPKKIIVEACLAGLWNILRKSFLMKNLPNQWSKKQLMNSPTIMT
jgi:hypothetical protein